MFTLSKPQGRISKISMIGEIKFFIGLQVSQLKEGIFTRKTKYMKEILKTFDMEEARLIDTPMVTSYKLSKEDESL